MNKSFLITEQERKRIIGMHTYATRTQHLNEIYEGGKIQEKGTHNELIRADGLYKKLIEMQTFNE